MQNISLVQYLSQNQHQLTAKHISLTSNVARMIRTQTDSFFSARKIYMKRKQSRYSNPENISFVSK